jgi:hypothetical protein
MVPVLFLNADQTPMYNENKNSFLYNSKKFLCFVPYVIQVFPILARQGIFDY